MEELKIIFYTCKVVKIAPVHVHIHVQGIQI